MRSPALRVWVGAILVALLAAGLVELRFDASYRAYFERDDPLLRAFDGVRHRFDPNDQLVVVVTAADGHGIYTPAGLELIRRLSERAALLPGARRVESLAEYPRIVADSEGFAIEPLFPDGPIDAAAAATVRAKVHGDRLIEGLLVDAHGRAALIVVTLNPPATNSPTDGAPTTLLVGGADALSEWAPVMHAAKDLVAANSAPGFTLGLSGIVAMNHAFAEATLRDTMTLIPLAFVALFVVVALALRSLLAALLVFLLSVATQLAALGVLGFSGVPLTSTVAMAPLMLLTITVADGVHVLLPLRALAMARAAANRVLDAADIASVITRQRPAILLATATTVVGFLTMNFSAVPTYRVLGNVVALGAAIAGALTLLWLPALLRIATPRWREASSRASSAAPFVPPRVPASMLWLVIGALAALSVAGIARLRIDDAFVGYFAPSMPFRAAADAQSRYFGGVYQIEFALESGRPDGVHAPGYLRAVDDFAQFLEAQPEVRSVHSWSRILQRIHARVGASEGVQRPETALPAAPALAAQYLLLYQLSLPLGHDANAWVDVDRSASRLVVALGDMRSSEMLEFEARALAWWQQRNAAEAANAAAGERPVRVEHGAVNLVFGHLGGRNVEAMLWANVWGVLAIAVMISITLRSAVTGALSVVMNLVPLGLAFAVWGFTARDVGLSLSVAAGMTLGILDHNAVHLLTAYLRKRRGDAQGEDGSTQSLEARAAIAAALREVAPGIVVTNAALLIGFCVLAQSAFALNADLGVLTALTLALALLVNLVLLPLWVLARSPRGEP